MRISHGIFTTFLGHNMKVDLAWLNMGLNKLLSSSIMSLAVTLLCNSDQ